MKFIVPAKTNSTRVLDKNWREFSQGKSLVQICVEKLLPLGEVVVTCEDATKRKIVESWGCGFHHRPVTWTYNEFPLTDWIRQTAAAVAPGETIGWCQVTSPLFDEYEDALAEWEDAELEGHDSLVVLYPKKMFLLDYDFRPIQWGFGEWHVSGQRMQSVYQMPWVFSVLTPESIERTGYHIGARPHWFFSQARAVDIDGEEDWEFAKFLFEQKNLEKV